MTEALLKYRQDKLLFLDIETARGQERLDVKSDIFKALEHIGKSERGEYEITDAISRLCEEGKVKYIQLADFWLNLGCPEDIEIISKFLNERERR